MAGPQFGSATSVLRSCGSAQLQNEKAARFETRILRYTLSNMEADLKTLQIDRSAKRPPEPSKWAVRWIVAGVAVFALLGMARVAYNKLNAATEVETVRVTVASTGAAGGAGVALNATGYIVAH